MIGSTQFRKKLLILLIAITSMVSIYEPVYAACGATDRTYDAGGGTPYWSINTNWSSNNRPNSAAENAIMNAGGTGYLWVYSGNQQCGCFEAVSGFLAWWTSSLTIHGDYFRALNPGSHYIGQNSSRLIMAGTAAQTLETVGLIPNLTITNNTSVTFTDPFSVRTSPVMSAASTTLYIDADFEVTTNNAWTVPAGNTVHVRGGATITLAGNLTVNGNWIMDAGTKLVINNGRTLHVSTTSLFQLSGADGNPVTVETPAGGTFNFNVLGSINAEYFQVSRTSSSGINVTGTIQNMENGEFHNIANSGYGITLGGASTIPSTMEGLGFYNEGGSASGNINASAYVGSPSDTFIDNWLGDIGGEGNDLDSNASCSGDPPGCITWGTESDTKLTITDATASGNPPANVAPNSGPYLFATFAFALTKADTATDITDLTLTQLGTADITEIQYVQLYEDDGDCVFDAGDTQIGSNSTLSGSPGTVSFSIPAATIQTNSATPSCVHVRARISALGVRDNTVRFQVASTDDVTNSQGYAFTSSSGPPLASGQSVITGGFPSRWTGGTSTTWNSNGNWFSGQPSSTRDCIIGAGERVTDITLNPVACRNADLQSSGTINWLSTTRVFDVYGNLNISPGYTFNNATSGVFNIRGATNQSITIGEPFPGNVTVNNTAPGGSNNILITGDSTINGNLTIIDGVVSVGDGVTLKVDGNLTVQTGAELVIDPGGTLILADGSVLTVDLGGTLTMVGTSTKVATVSSADGSSSYTVNVNGTIAARYYLFSRMGATGISVNAGATIDATNHLQNGAFTEPVANNTDMLRLFRTVPTNFIDNMSFDSSGSTATGTNNIYTNVGVAGPLVVDNYSGDLSGPALDDPNTYLINWTSPTNSIHITQEASTPATMSAGSVTNIGRWGFQQALAGASFVDADITTLRVTMTGTGNTGDVDNISIFYDDDCDSAGGSLIGSSAPSGSPGSVTFSIGAGNATIDADLITTPKRCIYVEYDIASGASDGITLGAKITSTAHFSNDQTYVPSGSTAFPVTLGSAGTVSGAGLTIWTGNTNTNWNTASNWTAGVPNSNVSCEVPNAANDPIINGITAICKSIDITNGIVTIQGGGSLEVYGNFENTGSLIQTSGNLVIRDDGATATDQRIESSSTISSLTFNKTAGGKAIVSGASTLTLNSLTFPGSSNFEFEIQSGRSLSMTSSFSVPSGVVFDIQGSGTLNMANATTINVTGGTFQTTGVNDAFPQATSNKATITSAGRWSFVATSGNVNLVGFILDRMDGNGLQINGTSDLVRFDGGQFTNLLADFATPVRALQLNTSTTITETTASNFGWHWQGANANHVSPPAPIATDSYYLVYAPNCGSQTLVFSQWFGDFWGLPAQPDTQDKILDSSDGAHTCTVSIDASASPVSITALTAIPYQGVVDISWTTGSELDHQGFNIFRSTNPNSGFAQVNSSLIKNITSSGNGQGNYIFRDSTVQNGTTYYYHLQDVATNGATTMHGPVNATPTAALASAPAIGPHDGTDQINNDPTDSSNADSDTISIAPDVQILSKSSDTFRIEISPSAVSFQTSPWNASYNTASMAHFSNTTEAGHPEQLARTILIPMNGPHTGISSSQVDLVETVPAAIKLAPAPAWVLNSGNGQLEPNWSEDVPTYATNAYIKSDYYEVETTTQKVGSNDYLAIKVWPLKYHPVSQLYKQTTKIILDVYTGSSAWENPPALAATLPPSHADNIATIKISKSGMYELNYNDLVTHFSDGPFINADINDLQMFIRDRQVPIEIISGDDIFNTGDRVRFYAEHNYSFEDHYTRVYFSPYPIYNSSSKRIPTIVSSVDGNEFTMEETLQTITFEENNYSMFDQAMGGHVDHFFWKRIYVSPETAGTAPSFHVFPSIDLEKIDISSNQKVNLIIDLRGRGSDFNISPTHKLAFYLNGEIIPSGTANFNGVNKQIITVSISASQFLSNNTLKIEALSDNLNAGEFSIVDIDKITIEYPQKLESPSEALVIRRNQLAQNIKAYNYSSEPNVYDVSVPSLIQKISGGLWTPGTTSTYEFNITSTTLFDESGPLGISGTKFITLSDAQFLAIDNISINQGYSTQLKESNQQADYIVIGDHNTLSAASILINHRANQGLNVKTVELQQIFNEFSYGRPDTKAIKDFLQHAYLNWQTPRPKYVLFIGDTTRDPLNHGGDDGRNGVIATRHVNGVHSDFPSDVWFVSDEIQEGLFLPLMSVGRIPMTEPSKIQNYIDKIISYEAGELLGDTGKHQLTFFSDKSPLSEGFSGLSDSLKATAEGSFSAFKGSNLERGNLSDADFQTNIFDIFHQTKPFMVTFNGHGGEDMWADGNVFQNSDINSLNNNDSLPIVISMNCKNGTTQFEDKAEKGLGELMAMKNQGGAIAFWGSSALTSPKTQEALATQFFSTLGSKMASGDTNTRIGDSILQSQRQLNLISGYQDVIQSWSLIGDPAMKFPQKVFPDAASEPTPLASNNSSSGCSAFGAYADKSQKAPWDLAFALLLEILFSLMILRGVRCALTWNN